MAVAHGKDDINEFVDTSGRIKIPSFYLYNNYKIYSPNRIELSKNNKHGLLDTNQNVIIPFEYDDVNVFNNGIIRVKLKNKYGLYNETGRMLLRPEYDNIMTYIISSNRLVVSQNDKYGCVDTLGNVIIPFLYDEPFYFTKGLAVIKKENCMGYMDSSGREIIAPIYDLVGEMGNGYIIGYRDEIKEWMDKTGKRLPQPFYDGCENLINGRRAVSKNNKFGFIDKNGNEIIPLIYDQVTNFSKDGVAKVFKFHGKKHGREGLIDTMGNELLHVKYTFLGHYDRERAYIREKPFGKSKYINLRTGLITQLPYSWIGFFYTNRAVAEIGNKMGFINLNGNVVIPIKYNYFTERTTGKYIGAQLEKDGKWGLIDTNGNEIIPFIYDKISGDVSDGLLPACKNGKWGYIDLQNNEKIPFIFNRVQPFKSGIAKVNFGDDECKINKEGKCIDNCK